MCSWKWNDILWEWFVLGRQSDNRINIETQFRSNSEFLKTFFLQEYKIVWILSGFLNYLKDMHNNVLETELQTSWQKAFLACYIKSNSTEDNLL